jgi:carboxymethylenebutenolidase
MAVVQETTDVRAEWVEYTSLGATISGYLATPQQGSGPWPAVMMVHENPGLIPHRQDVTRRLAKLGYVVLTPNLYSRVGGKQPTGKDDLDERRNIVLATQDEQVHADLLNGVEYLKRARPEADTQRLGLFGNCMGGQKGFYTATHSTIFTCYLNFYGPVIARAELQPDRQDHSYLPFAKDLSCPMQYHVGDQDTACPMPHVEMLKQELAKHHKDVEFFVYPGAQHAFHGDHGPRYHPEAARLAWERGVRFLDRYLKP